MTEIDAIRSDGWGFVLGLIATVALYGAPAWIGSVIACIRS